MKTKMQKRRFRIGELAKHLAVEKFVVRFWEKEFDLKTNRSHGGQRFYDEQDIEQFKQIKALLYDGGFTIAGAKKQLKQVPCVNKSTDIISPARHTSNMDDNKEFILQQITQLHEKLVKLRTLL